MLLAGWWRSRHSSHQIWQPHHQAIQLWSLPRHHLQRAAFAPETFCSGCIHDHCHCPRLLAELRSVPCCQGCSGTALRLEPRHYVSPGTPTCNTLGLAFLHLVFLHRIAVHNSLMLASWQSFGFHSMVMHTQFGHGIAAPRSNFDVKF